MIHGIQASLIFATAGRRDNVLAFLQAQIAGRNRWGVEKLNVDEAPWHPPNGLVLEVRFVTQQDADNTWNELTTLSGQRNPEPGSVAVRHSCDHDAHAPAACTILDTFTWT